MTDNTNTLCIFVRGVPVVTFDLEVMSSHFGALEIRSILTKSLWTCFENLYGKRVNQDKRWSILVADLERLLSQPPPRDGLELDATVPGLRSTSPRVESSSSSVEQKPLQEEILSKKSILQEAEEIIHGDRNADYGHPKDNHEATAILWEAYLTLCMERNNGQLFVRNTHVCTLNILQKISRSLTSITRDTLVDIAGYAGNIEMIWDAENS